MDQCRLNPALILSNTLTVEMHCDVGERQMEQFIKRYCSVARFLSLSIVPLCILALLLIIGLTSGEVILRFIRGKGITDSLDMVTALVPVTACTALACAQLRDRNVRVTIFIERFSESTQELFKLIGMILGFIIVVIATIMGIKALLISLSTGEYFSGSHLTIPAWPGKLMMPLGFGILSIQLSSDILESTYQLVTKRRLENIVGDCVGNS